MFFFRMRQLWHKYMSMSTNFQGTFPLEKTFSGRQKKILDIPIDFDYSSLISCGCSSMVERKLPKLKTRVRFPSPAPNFPAATAVFLLPVCVCSLLLSFRKLLLFRMNDGIFGCFLRSSYQGTSVGVDVYLDRFYALQALMSYTFLGDWSC